MALLAQPFTTSNPLADAIRQTLFYFDVQDHPLTLVEIQKYLLPVFGASNHFFSLSEIVTALAGPLSGEVNQQDGFYFLPGRSALVQRRLQNNYYATVRIKRIKRFLPLVRFVPFISAVALSGSEALSNSKKGSDIDLLVLTNKNRLWLGRLCMAFFFQLLGMRRHGRKIENRFCLNHYVFTGKQISSDTNLYTAVEYASLVPFFGGPEIFRFQKINEKWVRQFLHQPIMTPVQTMPPSRLKMAIEIIFNNVVGNALEKSVGALQLKKIKIFDYIIVDEDELSFHPGSKGQQILGRWRSVDSENLPK